MRMLMLKQHYRSPLPFDLELLDEAKKIRAKLNNFVSYEMATRPEGDSNPAIAEAIETASTKFAAALADDLNTSAALAVVHELMTTSNRLQPSKSDAEQVIGLMQKIDGIFDVLDQAEAAGGEDDAEIDALIVERNQARSDRNFQRADEIRDTLKERGIEILDTPQGTHWRRI